MKISRLLLLFVFIGAASLSGFSQQIKKDDESSREGLRKISGRSHDVEFDIDINEAAIEKSIEEALKSVEGALKNLEIHIEPIQVDLKGLMMDIHPIIVGIPDIQIEPIDIDLDELRMDIDDLDIDIDIDEDLDFHNDHQGDLENKSDDDRSKGLKKIN